MAGALLSLERVESYYGPVRALSGISLDVREGEIVTLIGANGAGKSTLLMTICGDPRAASGRVVFDGVDITREATHRIVRRGIAQAPEGRRIFPRMTVLENLLIGTTPVGDDNVEDDLARVFSLFPILRDRAAQRGGTLSGGEQQMLAIARALMSRPRLLLLDEPSLGLAPLVAKQIFAVIRELNERDGMTILLVEQNAHHALNLAHRGYVLANGVIVAEGAGRELLADERVRAAYLEGGVGAVG